MQVAKTGLADCWLIHDTFLGDKRGYFFESFNKNTFRELTGLNVDFVQDNQSMSQRGVLRGLHYQKGEHAQAKLVRVLKGKVLDVVVDLRKDSASFGQHLSFELSEDSHTQLFVPRGFAHGFLVLSETAVFFYKVDNYYRKQSEGGIIYNDKTLGINWGDFLESDLILSEKDMALTRLQDVIDSLNFHL